MYQDILPVKNVWYLLLVHTTFQLEEAPGWTDNTHNPVFVLVDVRVMKAICLMSH